MKDAHEVNWRRLAELYRTLSGALMSRNTGQVATTMAAISELEQGGDLTSVYAERLEIRRNILNTLDQLRDMIEKALED